MWLQRVKDGNAKHPERPITAPLTALCGNPNEREIERLKVRVVCSFFPACPWFECNFVYLRG